MKIWRRDDQRLLSDCIQQMNIADDGKRDITDHHKITAPIFQ